MFAGSVFGGGVTDFGRRDGPTMWLTELWGTA